MENVRVPGGARPRPLNVLLVLPAWAATSSRWKTGDHALGQRAFFPPLSLATVAALTPPAHHVDIWDEAVHGPIDEDTAFPKPYDLVGVGGYVTSMARARQVVRLFRRRGVPVVVGGAGVTSCPDFYQGDVDTVILGESERTWPAFLSDFQAGTHRRVYRDTESVDMALSPPPDWRNLTAGLSRSYAVGVVQSTRGCPFVCEFCIVWKTFGRTVRVKSVPQVLAEIEQLHRLGMRMVLFCEDNFYGDRRHAKAVLRELVALNERLDPPLRFCAEISINIARDDEVLELLVAAGFAVLFIGIESPNEASLAESAKVQNLKGDLVETCLRIQSYGLPIEASMIVGFDHDDASIFDRQRRFFDAAHITLPRLHMLQARPGTNTFERLVAERRVLNTDLLHEPGELFDSYLIPNVVPLRMGRRELFEGYLRLVEWAFDWDSFTARVLAYLEGITYEPALRRVPGASNGRPGGLEAFVATFDERLRPNLNTILSVASERAPAQLANVITMIVRHNVEVAGLPDVRRRIERQIAFERDLDLSQCLDDAAPGTCPTAACNGDQDGSPGFGVAPTDDDREPGFQ